MTGSECCTLSATKSQHSGKRTNLHIYVQHYTHTLYTVATKAEAITASLTLVICSTAQKHG